MKVVYHPFIMGKSRHINIDRCDIPRRFLRKSRLGEMWKCDCGKTWVWTWWHDRGINEMCKYVEGWRKEGIEGRDLDSHLCAHRKTVSVTK